MTINEEAERHVREMIRLGATFSVVPSEVGGDSWIHECAPGTRAALRAYKSTAGLDRIGMRAAMTAAVRRLEAMRGAA